MDLHVLYLSPTLSQYRFLLFWHWAWRLTNLREWATYRPAVVLLKQSYFIDCGKFSPLGIMWPDSSHTGYVYYISQWHYNTDELTTTDEWSTYFSPRHVEWLLYDEQFLKHNHNPNAAGGVSHVFERGLREWPHKQYPNLLHDNDLTFNSWWYTVYVCMFCDVSLCPNQFQFRRCFFVVLGEASHVPHRVVGFGPPGFSGRLPRPCSTLLGATEPALRWVHLDVNFPLKQ